jgi:excisionase family DNA binding protein
MKLAIDSAGKLRKFYSQQQVADALGLTRQTIRALIQRHELTAVRIANNCLRVPAEEVERFLQARREGRAFTPDTHPNVLAKGDQFFPAHEEPDPDSNPPEAKPQPRRRRPRGRAPRSAPAESFSCSSAQAAQASPQTSS